jgi:hypothetical protein
MTEKLLNVLKIEKRFQKCLTKFALGLVVCSLLVQAACNGPKIAAFTPEKGPVGTEVTITGEDFKVAPAENTVKFGGVAVPTADIITASTTELKVKVPAGAKTGLISITTSDGTGYSKKDFIVESPPAAKWTFLVYLDADNNLEPAGIGDFQEMASVGSSPELNIVVQMDRVPGYSNSYGDWTGTRRFLIKKNDEPDGTPLQDLGEKNMGDPEVLRDFVEWGVTHYPAEHYAVVIWNHGDGWRVLMRNLLTKSRDAISRGEPDPNIVKAVASDDTDEDILYMKEVQTALETAQKNLHERDFTFEKFDVVGFDACLMGMVEVAYAVRNAADYVVGSEESEPGNGWPYDRILQALAVTPTLSPNALASTIVTGYINSYPPDAGVTQSAVDISRLSNLVEKINAFTAKATTEWPILKTARLNSRQYHPPTYTVFWGVDLWDFADKVYNQVTSADIKAAALDLKNAINDFMVKEGHSSDMTGSNGIAIYFPPDKNAFNNDPQHTGYEESNTFMPVDFVLFEKWDNWLKDFYSNIP